MQVMSAVNKSAVALGKLKPLLSPPLRITGTFPAISVSALIDTVDVGSACVFVRLVVDSCVVIASPDSIAALPMYRISAATPPVW
jgi:hypothetical protein